jgi:hypothetical protein
MERIWPGQIWRTSFTYDDKPVSQYSRCVDPYSNRAPPVFKLEALPFVLGSRIREDKSTLGR